MSSSSCPICFETFVGKSRATPEHCKHVFCLPCLQTWSKTDNVCPIDRMRFKKIISLDSDSIIQIKPRKRRPKRVFYDVTSYCEVCKVSNNGDTMLLCDTCDLGYHFKCLTPPLANIPNNAWNCPECVAIDLRLKAKNSRTKDRTLSIRFAKKSRRGSGRTVCKTKELRIRYNSKHRHGDSWTTSTTNCVKMERTPKKNNSCIENYDQPGPSTSTGSREGTYMMDDDFDIRDSDFCDSSSDDSCDEISGVIDRFHQEEEQSNGKMPGGEGSSPILYDDEFQDFDFAVFSENEESMIENLKEEPNSVDFKPYLPVSSEPCNSATSTCKDTQLDIESNDSFDIDVNFDSSSENSESEVQNSKLSIKKPSTIYRKTEDGCYLISPSKIKNETHSVRKSGKSSSAKPNNPATKNLSCLFSKHDFRESLKELGDLNQTMESGKNLSSEKNRKVIENAKESEESLHAQQNVTTVNDLNFSSSEDGFKKSENQPGHLNIRNNSCNVSSNEESEIEVDYMKKLSESLHEKPDHSTINNLTSSPSGKDFMKNLKKYRHLQRNNYSSNSSWGSLIEVGSVVESEESLHAKQNTPKETLNRMIDGGKNLSSEENHNGIDSMVESETKPKISTINDLNLSSSESNFMKNLKSARELKRKNHVLSCGILAREKGNIEENGVKENSKNINNFNFSSPNVGFRNRRKSSYFKVTSPIKDCITNEAGSQVKSKTLDVCEPDVSQCLDANSCNIANSTFENEDFNTSSSISLEKEMGVDEKQEEKLCLDIDSCNTTSESSESNKAILLKLPLRLSFKRSMSKTSDKSETTSMDNISASICTVASVASMQHLDSDTAIHSDVNLVSNSATFSTYNDLHPKNSTNMDEQINSNIESTSVPVIFSLIEEQNAFEPLPIRNTESFYSNDSFESCRFIGNPWSNFYPRQAISFETSPTKKLTKTDYTLNMEKSGNLTIPPNASHLFRKRIFVKDIKQLSVNKDGALFLNWKHSNS